jgi:glucosamine--fructose-6-phosphate aminotransferase (isomerizing)
VPSVHRLEGAFTLVATHADFPEVVVGARRNSPLVVGRGQGENFLASDVAAFIAHTRDAVELGQDQVVELRRDGVTVTDFDGNPGEVREYHVDWDLSAAEKGGYDFFMLKEIDEQPQAVADTMLGRLDDDNRLVLDEMRLTDDDLRAIDKIIVVACGTSFHAGLIAKYAIEHWTRIPCEVELASEFRYRDPVLTRSTLIIAISQSGETMDTLMALRHARDQQAKVLSICNTNGSTMPRESDAVLYTHAGPGGGGRVDQGLSHPDRGLLPGGALPRPGPWHEVRRRDRRGGRRPAGDAAKMTSVLERLDPVRALAVELSSATSVLFLGRHVGYPTALEGALKLKELAYMHAEGFAAGELKHGPIALIEEGVPVITAVPSPRGRASLHDKVVSNIQEVRARARDDRDRRGGRRRRSCRTPTR